MLVTVSDSGLELPPVNLARIFDAFYTTKASGLGLGLSICRSNVEAHGGRLWAMPNEPHGAVFRVMLPVGEQPLGNPGLRDASPALIALAQSIPADGPPENLVPVRTPKATDHTLISDHSPIVTSSSGPRAGGNHARCATIRPALDWRKAAHCLLFPSVLL